MDKIPIVSAADVDRILKRDFSVDKHDQIGRKLKRYGMARHEREVNRVLAAILKCANGDTSKIDHFMEVAIADYRDILCMAEYPNVSGRFSLSAEERVELSGKDWLQYQNWFTR